MSDEVLNSNTYARGDLDGEFPAYAFLVLGTENIPCLNYASPIQREEILRIMIVLRDSVIENKGYI